MLIATSGLAARLERAEADTAAAFGRRAAEGGAAVAVHAVGGTFAVYGGPGQPFNIPHAVGFATLLTAVTIAVSFAQAHWGRKIAALGAALAGLADAHAAAGSALSMVASGQIDARDVVFLVLLGLSTNTLSRSVIAFTSGGTAYGWRVTLGLFGATLGAWGAAWHFMTSS